jgi:transcriptional regulator with XRE-family HTH domain
MAILELRAARGWSLKQTADTLLVTPATIASWVKRIDENGPDALLQLREPVNKFPDFVRYIVQRLKTLSPSMGKVKIAEALSRAGLHLGVTTVGRILKEAPQPCRRARHHPYTSSRPIVPTMSGMSTSRPCRHQQAFGHLGCRSHYPSAGRFAGGWQCSLTITPDAWWALRHSGKTPLL